MSKQIEVQDWEWLGRSLANYKAMHGPRAEKAGKGYELAHARTLTAARKIVFGEKPKRHDCRCGNPQCRRNRGEKSSGC